VNGNILITGGSGFLGRGIMLYAKQHNWDAKFTVYSRDEQKQDKCRQVYPANYILGDICDTDRLALSMVGHDTVIHAAALKYIPEGEFNASECVRVNITGAQSVIKAARQANVSTVIGISTDKAVSPVNVYGMTKAIMERLFAEASKIGSTKFVCCRYGNVIGSTGSVIPLFVRLVKQDKRLAVTDIRMTRFWISVKEAVKLIDDTAEAPTGSVVIPQPRSMSIYNLALSLTSQENIDIIGIRPGEKLSEDLLNEPEVYRTRKWGSYYLLMPPGYVPNHLDAVPSTLKSDYPSSWISGEEMSGLIYDSEFV
jgi:UDP-N-acetylglucosamine 4,6-dehydratase